MNDDYPAYHHGMSQADLDEARANWMEDQIAALKSQLREAVRLVKKLVVPFGLSPKEENKRFEQKQAFLAQHADIAKEIEQ